jgi:replicative DNA helicase
MFEDPKLEIQYLGSICRLAEVDLQEARRHVESNLVDSGDFVRSDHFRAYSAICSLVLSGVVPDGAALVAGLKQSGLNPDSFVGILSDGYHHESADGLCSLLRDLADKRQTSRQLEDSLARLKSGADVYEVKARVTNHLSKTRGRKATKSLDDYVSGAIEHVENVRAGKVKPVIPTYIKELDKAIGGWQNTLVMIGAEPGVGKSALIATGVHLQAANGHKPLVISLEDEPTWLAWRLMSHQTKINQFDMRFQKLGDFDFAAVKGQKGAYKNIRVIDGSTGGMRIEDVISSATEGIVSDGCDSIWIDHAGEILLTATERTDLEIARHLSLLRGVANRFGVPVIVAGHLKRQSDPSAPPLLSSFANSSGAERKARVALGLQRKPGSDILSVHILKQTNGPAGQIVDLRFAGAAAMIMDAEGGIQ